MRIKIIKEPKTLRMRPERNADLEYFSVMTNTTQSDIVENLIGKYLKRKK